MSNIFDHLLINTNKCKIILIKQHVNNIAIHLKQKYDAFLHRLFISVMNPCLMIPYHSININGNIFLGTNFTNFCANK